MRNSLTNLKKVFVNSKNKAINTKASVACNWAGAMMQKLHANVWTEAVILPEVGVGGCVNWTIAESPNKAR